MIEELFLSSEDEDMGGGDQNDKDNQLKTPSNGMAPKKLESGTTTLR